MSRKAIVVEFPVKPELVEQFVENCKTHAQRCLDNEEGCYLFEVSVADEYPNTVFLYEAYTSEEALAHHNAQPYLQDFIQGFLPMLSADRRRHLVTVAG